MTLLEMTEFCITSGFTVISNITYYHLQYELEENIIFEIQYPSDKADNLQGYAISWTYRLWNKDTNEELFKDWIEHYGNEIKVLIDEIRNDVLRLINLILNYKFRIREEYLFTVYKWRFGKIKKLEFNTLSGWESLY